MTPTAAVSLAQALHACWRGRWLASPPVFYAAAGPLARACWIAAALSGAAGLVAALGVGTSVSASGEAWRIAYAHVPAAWTSLLLYLALAACSALVVLGRGALAAELCAALLPSGALMSLLAIGTGVLWGRPTSGAWWAWDVRLLAELGLLLTYLGGLVLPWFVAESRQAERATALLALAGIANLALVHSSGHGWPTLSSGAPAPASTPAQLSGMALMTLAFSAWSAAVVLQRARVIVLERERRMPWARALAETLS